MKVTLLVPGFDSSTAPAVVRWTQGHQQLPWQAQFGQLLGHVHNDGLNLPAARLLHPELDPAQHLVCADPIHLKADRDTATVIPGSMLELTAHEADQLLDTLNEFLRDDALSVSRQSITHWYLAGKDGSQLTSYPSSFLAHRNASAYLPEGEHTGAWRRLMTELQMLLHSHPVNVEREQRGKMPVNSVWFWGGGLLPSQSINHDHSVLYADTPYAVALAQAVQLTCYPLGPFQPSSSQHTIMVDTRISDALFAQDEMTMRSAQQRIIEHWLLPLQHQLNIGAVSAVTLINEDGEQGILSAEPPWWQQIWKRLAERWPKRTSWRSPE